MLLLFIPLLCWFDLCEKGAGVPSHLSILTFLVFLGMMFVPLGIYWAGKGTVITYKQRGHTF
jgi:hypothetical protein